MSNRYEALDAALLATLREGACQVRELIDVHKPLADSLRNGWGWWLIKDRMQALSKRGLIAYSINRCEWALVQPQPDAGTEE